MYGQPTRGRDAMIRHAAVEETETVPDLEERIFRRLCKVLRDQLGNREKWRPGPRKECRWTKDGKPICLYCDASGHVSRDCSKKAEN